MNELPWDEKLSLFQINPAAASLDDIARMAMELHDFYIKEMKETER